MKHTTQIMKHMTANEALHDKLRRLIHEYILLTYKHTKKYPGEEKFGLTSQDRRAAVSVMLNHIEGYARMRVAVNLNQEETAFGSLKESFYCRYLAAELGYITWEEYRQAKLLKEEIARMLYSTIEEMKNQPK